MRVEALQLTFMMLCAGAFRGDAAGALHGETQDQEVLHAVRAQYRQQLGCSAAQGKLLPAALSHLFYPMWLVHLTVAWLDACLAACLLFLACLGELQSQSC